MLYTNLNIASEDLPEVEQHQFEQLPKRYLRFRLIGLGVFLLVFSAGPIALLVVGERLPALLLGSGLLVLFALKLIVEFKAFPMRGYLVRDMDIHFKKGWIFREFTSIPYNRIQHCEVSQGPIARAMKLSTLKIYTAGGASSDLSIRGMEPQAAERLRAWITEKTSKNV